MRGQSLNVQLFGAWFKICNDEIRMSPGGPLPSGQCTSSWCVVSNSPLILIPVVEMSLCPHIIDYSLMSIGPRLVMQCK